MAVTVSVVPFRLACLNGMLLPIEGAQRTWKARHTANVEAKLADARRTLGIAWRYYDQLERLGGRLIRKRIDGREFGRFLARLVPLPAPGRTRPMAAGPCATRSGARGDPNRLPGRARPGECARHALGRVAGRDRLVDHVQPTRQTARRTHAETRFERATEPQPLKDRALELLTEGGDR